MIGRRFVIWARSHRIWTASLLVLILGWLGLSYRSQVAFRRLDQENSQKFAAIMAEIAARVTVTPTPTTTATSTSSSSSLPPCASATATGCDRSKLPPAGSNGSSACTGTGPATITASPIAISDIALIQPMGLEIGGHVTPIDHGYFYIKGAMADPPTEAPVYVPFDAIITSVSRTVRQNGSGPTHPATYDDVGVKLEATCTFRVRFSNLIRLAGGLQAAVGDLENNHPKTPKYAVKAGELIGYTGLPTAYGIDVWVENDQSTLTGFVNPNQYTKAESWKTHVVDLFASTNEPLKSQLLALVMRDAEPRWGKIDYDQDGKLVGTWFKAGTSGYGGNQSGGEGYWVGHLSIVPNGNDPTWHDISFGDYQGQAAQFAIIGNQPDPADVSQATGLVKYELGQIENYSATTGESWNHRSYLPHIRTRAGSNVQGTVLFQLLGTRSLKMETFPGKPAAEVMGFTDAAVTYER